jgi:undecaprenyl phosphate N,N'-diacetylbacillosamine 1-phosphate transferase
MKRALDLVLATATAFILGLLFPFIAAAIMMESGLPIFFRQRRIGKNGKVFDIVKFRTMVKNAPEQFNSDGSRFVGKRDERITKVGRFLRLGFDELPQVMAVVRGDMSFIGPRPDDAYATSLYAGAEWLKLSVRPGITGLSQVCGRNDLPWRQRLRYDVYYAGNRTLALDFAIAFRTVRILVGLTSGTPPVSEDRIEAYWNSIKSKAASIEAMARQPSASLSAGE